ncbi:MAG: BMP family protein [Chloroflexota bacterium]
MRSSMRLLSLGATAAFIFAACSSGGGAGASSAPSAAPSQSAAASESAGASPSSSGGAAGSKNYTACVAFDTGGLGDKGFNDLAKKGLEDAQAQGFTTFFSEARGATDYAANIQRLIDQGCQSIVTVGFNQAAATVAATKANPDIAFSQVDNTWDEKTNGPTPDNFTGLSYQIDQAAMLAGYLAAGFTKTGKIGTYGGQQFAGVTLFMDGLSAGIKYHNQEKGTDVKLLGWDAASQKGTFVGGNNPWGDPAKGEQLAKTLVDQGVDIVHPVSGATGNGSIKYMLSKNLYAIGVDTDQAISLSEYAKAILTSAQKAIDVSVIDTFNKNQGGDLGGENYVGTLENKGVLISPYHDFDSVIPADLKSEVDTLAGKIADGSVKVADYLK